MPHKPRMHTRLLWSRIFIHLFFYRHDAPTERRVTIRSCVLVFSLNASTSKVPCTPVHFVQGKLGTAKARLHGDISWRRSDSVAFSARKEMWIYRYQ
jgi:hypothetical protein